MLWWHAHAKFFTHFLNSKLLRTKESDFDFLSFQIQSIK